jgi:hypothetical protein
VGFYIVNGSPNGSDLQTGRQRYALVKVLRTRYQRPPLGWSAANRGTALTAN